MSDPSAPLTLRRALADDLAFAFAAKREALGPHVAARWGWDDAIQREIHWRRWAERPWFVVELAERSMGTVSIGREGAQLRFGEFYLLPDDQRRGIGTRVLSFVLAAADAAAVPVVLEHLHGNAVGALYRRHGFVVARESGSHVFLVRQPDPAGAIMGRTLEAWLRDLDAVISLEDPP